MSECSECRGPCIVGHDWRDERDRLEAEVNRWHAEATKAQLEAARLLARAHTAEGRVRYLESMQRTFLTGIDQLAHIFPEANRRKILDWIDDMALIRDARSGRP